MKTGRGKAPAIRDRRGKMQSGYFVVEQTAAHAALIFPSRFVGATPVGELRMWLNARGIHDPIIYQPAPVVVIPITEIGASA